jgi:MYXO-CTERM domain-containing protein
MKLKGAIMPSIQSALRHLSVVLLALCCIAIPASYAQDGGGDGPSAEDLSETQTAFYGARLLCGPTADSPNCPRSARGEVSFGRVEVGDYDDFDGRDRYSFWTGDSLFAGVIDDASGNRVDAVAEFYWFESSVPRDSDFYVVVLKVAAAPNQTSNWRIATDPSIVDNLLFRDIGPIHRIKAMVERNGNFGAIRWDWSVPHQNYRWEPAQVIEVEQEYTAGVNVEGNAMRSLTEGVSIQAKGYLNAMAKVSTRYTITLWRWEMRVQPGATDMIWNLTALDPEHDLDPAYHEYFLVIQAPRGREARLEGLDFGGTFRQRRGGWADSIIPDSFDDLSIRVADIVLRPPQDAVCPLGQTMTDGQCVPICEPGFKPTGDRCVLDCPEGFIADNNRCIPECGDGFEADGNDCAPICGNGERFSNGRCVPDCGDGLRLDNNRCVPICQEGERLDDDTCVSICPEDRVFEGGTCVLICEDHQRFNNGDCDDVCARGQTYEDGECTTECGPGFVAMNGRCELDCPPGTHLDGTRCVRDSTCPPNSRLQGGVCIPTESSTGGSDSSGAGMEVSNEGGCSVAPSGSSTNAVVFLSILALGLRRRRS